MRVLAALGMRHRADAEQLRAWYRDRFRQKRASGLAGALRPVSPCLANYTTRLRRADANANQWDFLRLTDHNMLSFVVCMKAK